MKLFNTEFSIGRGEDFFIACVIASDEGRAKCLVVDHAVSAGFASPANQVNFESGYFREVCEVHADAEEQIVTFGLKP